LASLGYQSSNSINHLIEQLKKLVLCKHGHHCKDAAGERRTLTRREIARLKNGCSEVFLKPTKYDPDAVTVCRLLASL
jgi:hypothetical protein